MSTDSPSTSSGSEGSQEMISSPERPTSVISYAQHKRPFWYLDDQPAKNWDRWAKASPGIVCLMISMNLTQYRDPNVRQVYVQGELAESVFPGDTTLGVFRRLFSTLPGATDKTVRAILNGNLPEDLGIREVALAYDNIFIYKGFFHKFTRVNAAKSLLIQLLGEDQPVPCICCERRWANSQSAYKKVSTSWPYYACRTLPGHFDDKCGNCMYHEQDATSCSYKKNHSKDTKALISRFIDNTVVPAPYYLKTEGNSAPYRTLEDILDKISSQRRKLGGNGESSIEKWIFREQGKN